jgi:hypothetical protein
VIVAVRTTVLVGPAVGVVVEIAVGVAVVVDATATWHPSA